MPAQTPVYSLSWSLSVVYALKKAYPRATEDVFTVYGLTTKTAALLLATRNSSWAYIRESVHRLEKLAQRTGKYLTFDELWQWESYRLRKFTPGIRHQTLDTLLERTKNIRAGLLGEGFPARGVPHRDAPCSTDLPGQHYLFEGGYW